jgi:GrpB-like predicted nucleotidyltransferase (UPF0157 family)
MISILPYQPSWRDEFETYASAIREALAEFAWRIDHIGSTSVPGLAAKDVIDIQVTVAELAEPLELALNRVGYVRLTHIDRDHIPVGSTSGDEEWRKWFFRTTPSQRLVNVHIRLTGRANQKYPLLFRDYLRAHPEIAQSYALVKMALAKHNAEDVDAYYDVKDPVCDIIMGGAQAWEIQTGWEPGLTDV